MKNIDPSACAGGVSNVVIPIVVALKCSAIAYTAVFPIFSTNNASNSSPFSLFRTLCTGGYRNKSSIIVGINFVKIVKNSKALIPLAKSNLRHSVYKKFAVTCLIFGNWVTNEFGGDDRYMMSSLC